MHIPHGTHILVTDGGKMLLFRNEGDGDYPNLRTLAERQKSNPPDRNQTSSAHGRAAAFRAGPTSTYEETDFHKLQEAGFVRATAEEINAGCAAGEIERLVVVADPHTLGELRRHYSDPVRKVLIAEIAKELVKHPVAEIERIVCGPPDRA